LLAVGRQHRGASSAHQADILHGWTIASWQTSETLVRNVVLGDINLKRAWIHVLLALLENRLKIWDLPAVTNVFFVLSESTEIKKILSVLLPISVLPVRQGNTKMDCRLQRQNCLANFVKQVGTVLSSVRLVPIIAINVTKANTLTCVDPAKKMSARIAKKVFFLAHWVRLGVHGASPVALEMMMARTLATSVRSDGSQCTNLT
jgi:hypothetical protein